MWHGEKGKETKKKIKEKNKRKMRSISQSNKL